MRRGFIGGLVAGGILGAAIAVMVTPHEWRPMARRATLDASNMAQGQVKKMWRRARRKLPVGVLRRLGE